MLGGQKRPVGGADWTAPRWRLGFGFSPHRNGHEPEESFETIEPLTSGTIVSTDTTESCTDKVFRETHRHRLKYAKSPGPEQY